MLADLERLVKAHRGEFLCERIHHGETKLVAFQHKIEPPSNLCTDLADVGGIGEFYETFGGILFYYDAVSGDAARRLANPTEWFQLDDDFRDWFHTVDESELEQYVPKWVDTCLVIGETPHSGNYTLIATEGEHRGNVFEFDHDGFEFVFQALDIAEYVKKLLALDSAKLLDIASHMRFIEPGSSAQWWIRELRENDGRVVTTLV